MNEDSGDVMLRWFNMTTESVTLRLAASQANPQPFETAYKSNILEEEGEKLHSHSIEEASTLSFASKEWNIQTGSCEIVTVGLRR